MTPHPTTTVRLFDHRDVVWIAALLDIVERSVGIAWRVLLERVEHAPLRATPPRIAAILSALRRVTGRRSARANLARRVRAAVLGHPVLDADARAARLAGAAAALELAVGDVESLLWADLAHERSVILPDGRPEPTTLAAYANLDRIQREIRRAHELEVRVWRDAHELVRMAGRCGLATTITRAPDAATVLRFAGPLSIVHATTVYGRALGALVPFLASHERFELDIHHQFASGLRTLRVAPPVLLPPAPAAGGTRASIGERLARALVAAGVAVDRAPAPLTTGDRVLYPDLAIDQTTRWYVEIIGFATADHLADKLARYRAAGARVILCLDARRSPREIDDPQLLRFERRIDARALVARGAEL